MSHTKLAFGLVGVLVVAIVGTLWYQSPPDLAEARKLLGRGEFEESRRILEAHLDANPEDYDTIPLLVEAMLLDPANQSVRGAEEICDLLEQVPDDAGPAMQARQQHAELALRVLHEVQRAERQTKRALAIDPNDGKANQMMWIIMQLTRRFPHCEPYYLKAYEAASGPERLGIMQNWYVSQFNPFTLSAEYDKTLEIKPGPNAEAERYGAFLRMEPLAAAPAFAGASLFIEAGQTENAMKLITNPDLDRSDMDSSFLALLVETLILAGQLDEAATAMKNWDEDTTSFMYHRAAAIVAEEVDADYDKAIEHYEQALTQWPAPVDTRTRHRYVACLKKAKQPEKAAEQETIIKDAAQFFDNTLHANLQAAMQAMNENPENPHPEAVKLFVEFYRRLGREGDAKRWEAVLATEAPVVSPTLPGNTAIPSKSGGF